MAQKLDILIAPLLVLSLFHLTLGQVTNETMQKEACDESIVKAVSKQCRNASKIKNLDDFYAFYENFDHLTNKCLRLSSALKKPSQASRLAEDECNQQNLSFYQVRQLAKLVARWRSAAGQVCNMEFAMRVYHLHHQLGPGQEQQAVLSRILRLLTNGVAWKCRNTLVKRIKNVQARSPDAVQHIKFIVNLVNVDSADKLVSKLKLSEHVNQFVPTLERELPQLTSGHAGSFGQDGYELKSVNVVRLSHDSVKMSCKAMKSYQVNILASLGLLASLGYGVPESLAQVAPQLKLAETRSEKELIQLWLMSSLICQSLRTVLKMQTNTAEGKLLYRFKVMSTQEADVSEADESDTTFATFKLPESVPTEAGRELERAEAVELLAEHRDTSAGVKRAAIRKAHLLTGPNYRVSHAMGTYLDVSQKEGRLGEMELVLGMKLEFEEMGEDEEEEEEEEEEE